MQWVLASGNQGKLNELNHLLADTTVTMVSQASLGVADADETGLSFIENAILKARHASNITGLPALADDSGLCVDALHGAPGLYSARYAGTHGDNKANIDKLLHSMQTIDNRRAYFYCAIALLRRHDDPAPIIAVGQWHGEILRQPQGDGGFGYDPIFYCPQHQCSAAELTRENKSRVSHRGQALQQLLIHLEGTDLLCSTS